MSGGSKEHVEKVRESKFNRQRAETDVLRANCGRDGYVFSYTPPGGEVGAAGQCEFHHALPICSLQDANILKDELEAEEKDFIHKCMAITTWDTNKKFNLIGLPTKGPYEDADRKLAKHGATLDSLRKLKASLGGFGALPDLPCHLNSHDKYDIAVINRLDSEFWPNLLDHREKCEDKGKNIRQMLIDECKHWKQWVTDRGKEHGGAAECWVKRNKEKKNVWYIPLSLHPNPPKTRPPPNIFDIEDGSTQKQWLENLFSLA